MKKLALLLPLLLIACTASPERLSKAANIDAARMAKPSKKLSTFAHYELKPLVLSPAIKARPEKVEQAKILEKRIQGKVRPLLAEWSSADKTGRSGTLIVQPELAALKIVSGGARFFAGAWSGDSFIDMDLKLIDGDAGKQIAAPRISKRAGSGGGALSIGQTDRNLHDYIAYITHRYLEMNY